ncbi:hypothetical protein FACS189437_01030 [Bacteroidia bacterium]|nr:hypothetical protein FACS189437_01030 [Bacteroidia bacterium]
MKKKLIFTLFLLFALFTGCFAEVYVFNLGKSKGKAPSYSKQGFVFVDAQALTKKLGGDTAFMAKSKQLRIKIGSFTALIAAGQKEVIINSALSSMPAEAEISGSKIYVPVELFRDNRLSEALGRQIIFSDGKYMLEDFFNVEYAGGENVSGVSYLLFRTNGKIKFNAKQANRGVVEIELENSVLKRQGKTSVKNKFIENFNAKKCGQNQCIRVLMTPSAKAWKFEEQDGVLVFKASNSALEEIPAAPFSVKPPPEDEEEDIAVEEAEVLPAAAFFDAAAPKPASSKPASAPATVPLKSDKTKMRIMIDPGHGGKDPGAVRKLSSYEKDINLHIAKELYSNLKKKGYEVKMTREGDTFLALSQRSKMANDFNSDLFVSIHVNTAPRSAAQGLEVYFRSEKATDAEAAAVAAFENEAVQYEEASFGFADMLLRSLAVNEYVNESSKLAGHVRNNMKSISGTGIVINPNSSVKQANFYVLKGVDAPAVLVECGYISNPSDKKQLNNKNVRIKIAEGIYKGILSYAKAEGWQ